MFDPMSFRRPWPPRRPRIRPGQVFALAFTLGFAIRDLMQQDSLVRRGLTELRARLERLVAPPRPEADAPGEGDEA